MVQFVDLALRDIFMFLPLLFLLLSSAEVDGKSSFDPITDRLLQIRY